MTGAVWLAALVLGADGVLAGSRLWASEEANVNRRMHDAGLAASGEETIRSQVMDLARKLDWPARFTARVLKNRFVELWHGHEAELLVVVAKYHTAWRRVIRTIATRLSEKSWGSFTK
jgi:nitronate monooxygenase